MHAGGSKYDQEQPKTAQTMDIQAVSYICLQTIVQRPVAASAVRLTKIFCRDTRTWRPSDARENYAVITHAR